MYAAKYDAQQIEPPVDKLEIHTDRWSPKPLEQPVLLQPEHKKPRGSLSCEPHTSKWGRDSSTAETNRLVAVLVK